MLHSRTASDASSVRGGDVMAAFQPHAALRSTSPAPQSMLENVAIFSNRSDHALHQRTSNGSTRLTLQYIRNEALSELGPLSPWLVKYLADG